MTDTQKKIISQVLFQLDATSAVQEETVLKMVEMFDGFNHQLGAALLTDQEKKEVIAELHARLSVRMDRGGCVKDKDHTPWYNAAKAEHPSNYWDRYQLYLRREQGWSSSVINELDKATDEIMDLLGNPNQAKGFERKGLCIGDVQSGKTSTYIGLMNKAADAGYRVIILLTGTIEKLRRQTQKRVDEGFLGLDSSAMTREKKFDQWIGVGAFDQSVGGIALTSTSGDFNKATAEKVVVNLASVPAPVIFVLKKNKSVLTKLEAWLKLFGSRSLPMLLIDDEADNASVNTKDADEPSAINAAIRKILLLFDKSNYVGFTATPYANIFIDPDSNKEMLDQDLFPRNFIYALEAPTNYIGALSIFSEDAKYSFMLKENDDCELHLREKHKKEDRLLDMPDSLQEAVASFFIANAVRDLRGHRKAHRTMMVNISRFIAVQNSIQKLIDGYVREFVREIHNYYLLGDETLQYEGFAFLKQVFEKHFLTIPEFEFTWEQVQRVLYPAVAPITVRTVNGGNAPKNLNYEDYDEDGLRLIAVGGFSLSRGLTLEGLCVSYFYRNSKMYDTLMQMGRWFGYRSHYADICQIWMSSTSISWYSYIAEATDELRREIHRMQDSGGTPEEFGLCVRSDKTALLVTARNKMKSARDYQMTVSLSGQVIETPYIHSSVAVLRKNLDATEALLTSLLDRYQLHVDDPDLALKHPQFLNVEKDDILTYLSAYNSHTLNSDFRTDDIVRLIRSSTDGTLDKWDVMVAGGASTREISFAGGKVSVMAVQRGFGIKKEYKALQMSGKNSRLGSKGLAKGGLTKRKEDEIEARSPKPFNQETWFKSGTQRNPLLVIYPVELVDKKDDAEKQKVMKKTPVPIIGLSIGIPRIDGKAPQVYNYKINLVKWKEILEITGVDDYEEIDETILEE